VDGKLDSVREVRRQELPADGALKCFTEDPVVMHYRLGGKSFAAALSVHGLKGKRGAKPCARSNGT
jgi:hypothetical protein